MHGSLAGQPDSRLLHSVKQRRAEPPAHDTGADARGRRRRSARKSNTPCVRTSSCAALRLAVSHAPVRPACCCRDAAMRRRHDTAESDAADARSGALVRRSGAVCIYMAATVTATRRRLQVLRCSLAGRHFSGAVAADSETRDLTLHRGRLVDTLIRHSEYSHIPHCQRLLCLQSLSSRPIQCSHHSDWQAGRLQHRSSAATCAR